MLLSAFAIAIAFHAQQPPLLLHQATRLVMTSSWSDPRYRTPQYEWLTDRIVLHAIGAPTEQRDRFFDTVATFDLDTGRDTINGPLSAAFDRNSLTVDACTPSPDGQKLLCQGWDSEHQTMYVLSEKGDLIGKFPVRRVSPGMAWHANTYTHASWTSDSKDVVETVADYENGHEVAKCWRRALSRLSEARPMPDVRLSEHFELLQPEIDSGSTFHTVWTPELKSGKDSWFVSRWNGGPLPQFVEYEVSIPGYLIETYSYSPDRSQIVWSTRGDFGRSPSFPTPRQLWLSGDDGTGMRLLGQVPADDERDKYSTGDFWWVRWLPSGKAISFMYRQGLYLLPLKKMSN